MKPANPQSALRLPVRLMLAATLLMPGSLFPGQDDTSEALTFFLCEANVAEWQRTADGIHLRLTESAGREFSELTGQHIGHRLWLVTGDRVLTQMVIRARIDSGRLFVSWPEGKLIQHGLHDSCP